METQKIANLLGNANNESSKLATRKWYIISHQNNTNYNVTYILVTGGITVDRNNNDVEVAFKNCAPFTKCITHINNELVDAADNLDIAMPMYNLIEYSDNYSDTSGSLRQFKRDESPVTDAENPGDLTTYSSSSFKYKSSLLKEELITEGQTRVFKGVKI